MKNLSHFIKESKIRLNSKHDLFEEVDRLKSEIFKLKELHPTQLLGIKATLQNKNLLLSFPTGFGKSLVYQLPALIKPPLIPTSGVTVVISPIKALIQDQVKSLRALDEVSVGLIHGDVPNEEQKLYLDQLNKLDFLFVTPEQLFYNSRLIDKLHNINLPRRFVFDEAHCIIEMGNSFRPIYLQSIENVIKNSEKYPQFQQIPITLLSATIDPEMRILLLNIFKLNPPHDITELFSENMDRTNFIYRIRQKPKTGKKTAELIHTYLLKQKLLPAIIFCTTKKECENLSKILLEQYKMKTSMYHSDVSENMKKKSINEWKAGLTQVMIATNAFGLGVHYDNVRMVIHNGIPYSLNNYIQQCGRAGRDGKQAVCLMLYNEQSFEIVRSTPNINQGDLDEMIAFCVSKTCVRKILLTKLTGKANPSFTPCKADCKCRE